MQILHELIPGPEKPVRTARLKLTNITRRTALKGATAALAGAGLAVAANALPPVSAQASEPVPLAHVTTRLGAAMDEVSALLAQWDPNFRAIINPDRDYWLQNRMLQVPMRTDALINAWCDACDECARLWTRVQDGRISTRTKAVRRRLWQLACDRREAARNDMLNAIRHDHRSKATPSTKVARVRS